VDGSGHHHNPFDPLSKLLEMYSDQGFPTSIVHSTPQPNFVIPPRAKRLSPETKFELVRRYLAGESALALSKDLGIHRTTALSILNAAGVKRRYRVMTETTTLKAIALYWTGKSFAEVGRELKVNPETIRHAFIKRGVKIRGAHERNRSS
jgi:transposase-like protein